MALHTFPSMKLIGVTHMSNRILRLVGCLAAVAFAAACGKSPDAIDRTQPNYLKKSDFLDGAWYMQDTVVEVPATSTISFEGLQGRMEKIRFEVQEKHLVAYRTYEWMPGTDPLVDQKNSRIGKTVLLNGKPYRGAMIAAYPIESHFDRQRIYNPATGEQGNVLEENTTDRPWYEREYMRVDWSRNDAYNLLQTSNPSDPTRPYANVYVTPVDQRPGDEAFLTEYATVAGKQKLTYFDFTVRAMWNPDKVDYGSYGEIPYCLFNPRFDCESAVVKTRYSFLRVDEDHVQDFEPLLYTDKMATKFGFFRDERLSYDRNRGVTESGRSPFANHHNIWVKAHETDATGKTTVIPVEKRTPQPIVYHLTPNFPANLLPAAKQIQDSWDHAFRRAVAVPRGIAIEDAPQMFYLCQTPVPAGAPAACGKEGLTPRIGDIRYNLVAWIDKPQMAGPLGYGPSGSDPETGEIIQAAAYIYGAGMDSWAGDAQQVLETLTGTLGDCDSKADPLACALDTLVSGKNISEDVIRNFAPTDVRRPVSGPWQSLDQGLTGDPQKPLAAFAKLAPQLQSQIDAYKTARTLPLRKENRRAVVDKLISQNPQLESELIDSPEVRAYVMAMAPGDTLRKRLAADPAFYRQVARQSMLRPDELTRFYKQRLDFANKHNIYLAEFADDAWYGLAVSMKDKFVARMTELQSKGNDACAVKTACTKAEARNLARTDIWNELRLLGFRSVTEHEVGHTLGLTHNFQGSYDAMNFKDGYWDLRKQTIGVMVAGKRVLPTSPQNLLDAAQMNGAQIKGRMREFQYSTIMDYGSRMNSDIHGIGKYDEAAILFGYAGGGEPGWVEVFKEARTDYQVPNLPMETDNPSKRLVIRGAHTEIPLAQVEHYTPASPFYTDRFHYTTLPFHFADANQTFEKALDQGIARMGTRGYKKWSELEPKYAKIEAALKQWNLSVGGFQSADWEKARDVIGASVPGMPMEVPYMYCSDYEVGANLACNLWDQGADFYEINSDWIQRYKGYYLFNNFKRDRFGFGPDSVLARNYSRLMANLPNVYQHWLFNIFWLQDFYKVNSEQMEEFFGVGDPLIQNYWTMAVFDGLNTMLQTLATPSAGYYGRSADGTWKLLPQNTAEANRLSPSVEDALKQAVLASGYNDFVYVPRGDARSMYTIYDSTGFDFFTRVNEVGHFWDQFAGMVAITQSETNFLGVDRGSDALRYSLPYYITFPKELARTYSGVWTQDNKRYAGNLVKNGDGTARVIPPVLARAQDYISGFEYPPATATPVDGNGSPLPMEKVEPTPPWTTRFYTQLYGMAYFTENFNQDFASQNQVFRLGSGESITPAPGYSVVSFKDPFGGGYSYAALKKDGLTELPAAPSLVQSAATYSAKWDQAKVGNTKVDGLTATEWEAKTREAVRGLEMMRGLYGVFGRAW